MRSLINIGNWRARVVYCRAKMFIIYYFARPSQFLFLFLHNVSDKDETWQSVLAGSDSSVR